MHCRTVSRIFCACIAGALLSWPVQALAYTPGNGTGGTGPTVVAGGEEFTLTARFSRKNGHPVPAGLLVVFFHVTGPAGDCDATFSPVLGRTDENGNASTLVVLPHGCPGTFVLAATLVLPEFTRSGVQVTTNDVAGPTEPLPPGVQGVTQTFTVIQAGGFPNTSADPPTAPAWWLILTVAAVAAVAVAGAFRLWGTGRLRWS
jgi:hypothetical protein